jgi:multiple sugar transport system permease protein
MIAVGERIPRERVPHERLRTALLVVLAIVAVFIIIFPFLWILLSAFREPNGFLSFKLSHEFPTSFYLGNFRRVLTQTSLLRWIGNSALVATSTTLLSLGISGPAAFALARLKFRGRSAVNVFLVLAYAVPSITIVVPLFVVLVKLHLNDTFYGLIIVHASFTIPFVTWVLTDFYRGIPADMEAAGYVDGASLLRVLWHIVFPLSIPAVLAAGAYAFILSWNDFLFALVIMNSDAHFTAPVGIRAFFTGNGMTEVTWAELMAASVLVTLPSVTLFALLQRYVRAGFLSGAVKG